MRLLTTSACLLALCAVTACQRLHDEKSATLAPGEEKEYEIPAQKKDMAVKVTATSADGPFSAYLYLKKDENEAEKARLGNKEAMAKLLAHKENAKDVALEATLPAGETGVVMLASASGKAVTVKLVIANK